MYKVNQQGVTVIEAIVAISIIGIMVVVVGFSVTTYVNARAQLVDNMKAVYLVEEGYEIIRALRDEDWGDLDSLTLGDRHYLDVSTTSIDFSSTPEIIDDTFYRSFVVWGVYRDADDDITSSTTPGATLDPDAKEIKVSVSGPYGTSSMRAILSNLQAE